MSGTYIKFFETPEHCGRCPFLEASYAADCFVSEEPIVCRYDRRPDDCPLIPVPEHGDLIDRKTALDSLMNGMVMTGYQSRAMDCVNEFYCPTIIPADKEDGE